MSVLIVSAGEVIVDLLVLRKKYLGGCQISSSKNSLLCNLTKCFPI